MLKPLLLYSLIIWLWCSTHVFCFFWHLECNVFLFCLFLSGNQQDVLHRDAQQQCEWASFIFCWFCVRIYFFISYMPFKVHDPLLLRLGVPSASVLTGTQLDPHCLIHDTGTFYFNCSSVPCSQLCQLTWPYSQMFGFQQLDVWMLTQ